MVLIVAAVKWLKYCRYVKSNNTKNPQKTVKKNSLRIFRSVADYDMNAD